MGTLVSPILGAAVAMPAASRCRERTASRVEEDRIGIVEETDEQRCTTTRQVEEKLSSAIRLPIFPNLCCLRL